MNCDDCPKGEVAAECAECRGKSAARADHQYDELREQGYRSVYARRLDEEAENRSNPYR